MLSISNIGTDRDPRELSLAELLYSSSNPLTSNFSVRLFSVTVRTTCSGAPSGMSASISSVTLTLEPIRPDR